MDIEKIPLPLPIGRSHFDQVIENGCYYVDKTLFIRDILDGQSAVTLCTRPRRFGKTLNQTMLKCFFEDTAPIGGKDTRALFRGLKIESAGERYMAHQGKYPVIFLSFKEAQDDNFDETCHVFRRMISNEFSRHNYVRDKIGIQADLELFEEISLGKGDFSIYKDSLKLLSKCLETYHGQKVVVLIDEYDVPLQRSWLCGYYKEMVNFIRPLLGSVLKDNPHLRFAVLTGCLRVSKESIFTGLNNFDVISILSDFYDEYFGFTQGEVDVMLKCYGVEEKRQLLRDWYDGYLFGSAEVYNPWSTILAVSCWRKNINRLPEPHWANTSGNQIVRDLIDRASGEARVELETLVTGGTISKVVREDITYDDVYKSPDNLWNFMFFTGYLKKVGEGRLGEYGELILDMSIPNAELKYIYVVKIREWFMESITAKNLDTFFSAILNGDVDTFQAELSSLLMESISYFDSAENFYHGFMAGVLSRLKGYRVKSNRESGHGRGDLVLYSNNGVSDKAVIFEFKSAEKPDKLPAACVDALKQIEENDYAAYWIDEGYTEIMKYGIGFCKKRCRVMLGS